MAMNDIIIDLESNLKTQLETLAKEIRTSESALLAMKEGYLKVQGALELIEILKKKSKETDDERQLTAALE